jgi:hypothetical protein
MEGRSMKFAIQRSLNVDARAIKAHFWRRVLYVVSLNRHLRPVQLNLGNRGPWNLGGITEASLCAMLCATNSTIRVGAKQETRRISYDSGITFTETMSAKERYIRVAAIDIMIKAGIWNICVVERY